ncbi:exonuclease SbcCD subunit D [Fusibacter ferrireducens]|uniref:Nuclease SbcCD subunit D n=1 Tax=Fusibacter ferrireducens TaxID=2785058 RepID=A0ABR9ZYN0_9FIRM|nr:exonuclease SbcCD subunit D [Fusibacter ferrireducens]MBF4694995.1 exonuclease SbcCD subunit D [Fusibacter ferrireducens]
MKMIHSADWHLGKLINNVFMTEDQAYILKQLKETLIREHIEVLMISGDIYDRSIPPVEAVSLLNDFLSEVVEELNVKVIISSGNHDSSERLSFGSMLLRKKGLYIVGKTEQGYETISLEDASGAIIDFHVMPFMTAFEARKCFHNPDLKTPDEAMAFIVDQIRAKAVPEHLNVVMAHGFVIGTEAPEESDSERPLNMGGTDAISYRHFIDFDYVALGHLHNLQRAGRDQIRYSGSLLKYSFSENQVKKGVLKVELSLGQAPQIEFLPLKPIRDMRVIKGPLDQLISDEIVSAFNCKDYIHAILTDRGELMEPMNTLRSVYPNILSMEKQSTSSPQNLGEMTDLRREKNPVHLFDLFYTTVEGENLEETERAFVKQVVENAMKGES